MADYFPHSFEAEITRHALGTLLYAVVFLPPELVDVLPPAGPSRPRFSGEINDAPISAAWQPSGGRWYAMLSRAFLKANALVVGDRVDVRFRIEQEDSVDRVVELETLLDAEPVLRARWEALTPGMRRGQIHRVMQARREPTRQKRLGEVIAALRGEAAWIVPPGRTPAGRNPAERKKT